MAMFVVHSTCMMTVTMSALEVSLQVEREFYIFKVARYVDCQDAKSKHVL